MTFYEEPMPCNNEYNGYTYIDTMNRAATERFFRLTHEKYRAALGDLFGREIKGIFTDDRTAVLPSTASASRGNTKSGESPSRPRCGRSFPRAGEMI